MPSVYGYTNDSVGLVLFLFYGYTNDSVGLVLCLQFMFILKLQLV